MERRRKTTVTLSLNIATVERIDVLAKEDHRSRSAMIQLILDKYLDVDGERAARRHEQLQEAYAKEYTEEEACHIFYQVVEAFKNFDDIFQEMRKYEHIAEKELFVALYNEGWVSYLESFNIIRLSGPMVQQHGRMIRNHTKIPPAQVKQIEDFPFQY